MPTGQVIVNSALTKLNILEQGGVPNVSDSNYVISELNDMWPAWGIDEGLIYAILTGRFALTAAVAQYTIGTPAAGSNPPLPSFNAPRPSRIYRASITQATGGAINANSLYSGGTAYAVGDTGIFQGAEGSFATYIVASVSGSGAVVTYTVTGPGTGYQPGPGYGTLNAGAQPGVGTGFRISITTVTAGGQNRNNLEVVEAARYYGHNDLTATGSTPDELYPDYNVNQDGFATLYLYPVPTVAAPTVLELEQAAPISAWSLTGNYNIPQGYQDAICWSLAFRCLSGFGAAVAQQVAQVVTQMAATSEERIRAMNSYNRKLPPPAAEMPGSHKAATQ